MVENNNPDEVEQDGSNPHKDKKTMNFQNLIDYLDDYTYTSLYDEV